MLVATLVSLPNVALAQADAKKAEFSDHYERGRRFYDIGKYPEAIDEYQKAYLAMEDPAALYNIAQCYRLADQPSDAIRFYRNYLRRAPDAKNRVDVEKKIADLERIIEERRLGTPPSPAIAPPSNQPPPPPPVPTAQPPGSPSPAPAPMPVAPLSVVTTAPRDPLSPPLAPPVEAPRRSRLVPYTLLIGGGAMVVTSMALGGASASKARLVETAAKNHQAFDPMIEKSGKALQAGAVVTGLVGVAAGVTGAILLMSARSAEAAGPGVAAVRTTVYPLLGPSLAGAGALVVF